MMEFNTKISYDDVVNFDPTLKYLIKDTRLDFDNLEHQVNVRSAAIVLAINKWIATNYRTKETRTCTN